MLSVPFIFYLLTRGYNTWALVLFTFSVCTDFIDGALARTRDQVTDLGKIIDPIADKMLILTILVYIGFDYLIVWVFTIFIMFEMVAVFGSALFARYIGRPIGANVFGKIKMILQSFSVGLFLLGLIFSSELTIITSEYILGAALIFAVLAGLTQLKRRAIEFETKIEAR